jgi:hypothetical protein
MIDLNALIALLNVGVAGVILALFILGIIERTKAADERVAAVQKAADEQAKLYEKRIADGDARTVEMRNDRDQWRFLALGSERRLDRAIPTVATAIGAPVPSVEPARPGEPET